MVEQMDNIKTLLNSSPKVALAMIIKGTEDGAKIKRTLDSVLPYVDKAFITVTWDMDGEGAKVAKAMGAELSWFQWNHRFDEARNFNFAQISDEYKYALWMDSDDAFQGGENIKPWVQRMHREKIDALDLTYNYEIHPVTQEVVIAHPRERITLREKFHWVGWLHETQIAKGQVHRVGTKEMAVNHYPEDQDKDAAEKRNIVILEKKYEYEEQQIASGEISEHDPRTEFYLARCYVDTHQPEKLEKAKQLLLAYVKHSGWDEEVALAWDMLGIISMIAKNYSAAEDAFLMGMKAYPFFPCLYIHMGMVYGRINKWDWAMHWTKLALGMPEPKTAVITTPHDDQLKALETLFFAFSNMHNLEAAEKAARDLVKAEPDYKEYRLYLQDTLDKKKMVDLSEAALRLTRELADTKEVDKIETLLGSVPFSIADNGVIAKLRNEFIPPREWPTKSVVIYCGPGFENWSPKSLKKGIGGSEEAVIQLAKRWVKQGYEVAVYAQPREDEGVHEGVTYHNFWKFNPLDKFDVFIAWRQPQLYDWDIKARLKLVDAHDVLFEGDWVPERMAKIDKIMIKSEYHRTFLPKISDKKFKVIPNGIDPNQFHKRHKIKRDPYLCVWTSSYDRGLENLLKIWPEVKKAVPRARLEICYGWNLFDSFYSDNPERMAWKRQMVSMMSADGIKEIGRIGHIEIAKKLQEASFFTYYSTFEEISCISVMKAMMGGAIPITTDYAALKETNLNGVRVTGDPRRAETLEAYKTALIAYLKEGSKLEKTRSQLRLEAEEKYDWDIVAQEWAKVFESKTRKYKGLETYDETKNRIHI